MASIAARYGFAKWEPIYQHPSNDALRASRPNPFVLAPGDHVFVPDIQPGTTNIATAKRHRFVQKEPRVALRVYFRDAEGKPLASRACEVEVNGATHAGSTDADGLLEHEVPARATQAVVRVLDAEGGAPHFVFTIALGALDPVELISGAQSRLNNLGFACPVSGKLDADTRGAVGEFQSHASLAVTGELDAPTRDALMKEHKV